mgnify:CR=1 FL=1
MMIADTMEAGREMDALIAEKVMGWKRINTPPRWECKADYGLEREWGKDDPFCPKCMEWPEYSTDISVAWQVVEEFAHQSANKTAAELGMSYFSLSAYPNRWWSCRIGKESSDAPTAPLAICRAALRACK